MGPAVYQVLVSCMVVCGECRDRFGDKLRLRIGVVQVVLVLLDE